MRRGNRGIAVLALLATLGLAVGLLAGASASASGGGTATASSLKKCLKKAKKKRTHHKRKKAKRRCHKKYKHHAAGTSSLVRATLTWDSNPPSGGNIDLDLWVFDSNGNRARAAADTIPNSTFSTNDVDAPGSETFTDLVYKKPGGRDFSFGVCYQDGGSQHVIYNLDYVTADGAHHSASEEYGSDGASSSFDGGAPIPANFCKAP